MIQPLRVLFVEDREDDAVLVQLELKRGGYQLKTTRVETRETMQEQLRSSEWDLIISDFSMPQFDAAGALTVLKESGIDLPFIIVSGTVGEETAVHALRSGAHDFIPKTNLKRLLPAVTRELGDAANRRERRRAEDQLRGSLQTVAAMFRATPAPIIVIDPQGRVLRWNPAAEQVFGWTAEEVIGKELPIVPKNKYAEFHDRLRRALKGEHLPSAEVTRLRKDGSEVRVVLSTARLTDGNGDEPSVMGIFLDVTEQRALEEQFRQAQKMEAVGRLAGGIAHDFNNVLTAIHGYASLLVADLPDHDEHRSDAQEIVNAAERAASFTRQLLAFSRKQVIQPEAIDLNVVVTDLKKLLDRMIGEHVALNVTLNPGPTFVFADKGQIEQVIINLVVNARDAMEGSRDAAVGLRTYCTSLDAQKALELRCETPGTYCVVEVTDRGMGIEPEYLELIFEPFFTTKDVGKGTGLGLSTVYGIARQNGGFVSVSSVVGEGSTFSLFLPEVEAPAEKAPAASQRTRESEDAAARTILVVEDEAAIRQLVVRVLERAGYRVLSAGDPSEALRILAEEPAVELLLTDLMLPQMSGKELAGRAQAMQPNLRVVLMSGYADEQMELDVPYLEKPFTPKELLTKLAELFDTR